MLKLILVRHGQTAWNYEKRIQGGLSDQPLSQKGKEQAQRAALALRNERLEAIYCSPLKRAFDTAQAITRYHKLKVEVVSSLSEVNAGLLEGLTVEQLDQQYADFHLEFQQGIGFLRMPGGESMAELQHRAWTAVENIRQRHPQGVVAVVGHAFSLTTIICRALNLELSSFVHFRLAPGGISILQFEPDKVSLTLFNHTCHLEGALP